MKVNLLLNNKPVHLMNLNTSIIKKIYNDKDLFILMGEYVDREDLFEILDIFENKNYILMAHSCEKLLHYPKNIPYLSIFWYGICRKRNNNTIDLSSY